MTTPKNEHFRECLNCFWLSCTIKKRCFGIGGFTDIAEVYDVLAFEAAHVAKMQAKAASPVKPRKNFFVPAPFAGYARRKRKHGGYGKTFNFLHRGNWHAVVKFFKNH